MKDPPTRNHVGFHSLMCAQYARQMLGLRARDRGGCRVPVFGDPSASCHGNAWWLLSFRIDCN
jgi:hypothetical protein